jgi:hypothetical protein
MSGRPDHAGGVSFRMTLEPKMRIHVEQHADHRGMPMPLKLHLGGHQVDVLEALDQWYADLRLPD